MSDNVVTCPDCRRQLRFAPDKVGKRIRCPQCKAVVETMPPLHDNVAPKVENRRPAPEPRDDDEIPHAGSRSRPQPEADSDDEVRPSREKAHREEARSSRPVSNDPFELPRRRKSPWYVFVLALLPLGMPGAMWLAGKAAGLEVQEEGLILMGVIGAIVTLVAMTLASIRRIPVAARTSLAAVLALAGYGFVGYAVMQGQSGGSGSWSPYQIGGQRNGFKVLLPIPASTGLEERNYQQGELSGWMYQARTADGREIYSVVTFPMPTVGQRPPPAQVLEGICSRLAADLQGRIVEKKDIQLGRNPGKELELELPGQKPLAVRIFHTRDYVFQIMAEGARAASRNARTFFDSFRVRE